MGQQLQRQAELAALQPCLAASSYVAYSHSQVMPSRPCLTSSKVLAIATDGHSYAMLEEKETILAYDHSQVMPQVQF